LIELPPALADHYRELLRAYVIMGAGNLATEMSALAELLATAETSAQQAMQLHVEVLEELIQGLGNRSARHVMNRADLLALEVMGQLADRYRQRAVDVTLAEANAGFEEIRPQAGESLRESLSDFKNALSRVAA
jgi:hypothetical protein